MVASDIAIVLGAVAVLVTALAGLVSSVRNGRTLQSVKGMVNGQSEHLRELAEQRAFLEGVAKGVREQGERPQPHPMRPPH